MRQLPAHLPSRSRNRPQTLPRRPVQGGSAILPGYSVRRPEDFYRRRHRRMDAAARRRRFGIGIYLTHRRASQLPGPRSVLARTVSDCPPVAVRVSTVRRRTTGLRRRAVLCLRAEVDPRSRIRDDFDCTFAIGARTRLRSWRSFRAQLGRSGSSPSGRERRRQDEPAAASAERTAPC